MGNWKELELENSDYAEEKIFAMKIANLVEKEKESWFKIVTHECE